MVERNRTPSVALDPNVLESLTDAVLREADPLLVVLFGSQATGGATADSDIDILVMDSRAFSPARSRRRLIGNIRRHIPPGDHPVDIMVFDPSEFNRWRTTTNHVVARALKEGVVLYERPSPLLT